MKPKIPLPDPVVFFGLLIFWVFLVAGFVGEGKLTSPQFGYHPAANEGEGYGTLDFPTLFHFVRGTLRGLSDHPYRVESMPVLLEPWVGKQQAVMPFISPPTAVLSMGPLVWLPPGIAWAFWSGSSVLVASCLFSVFRKRLAGVMPWHLPLLWLLAVNVNSLFLLRHGQTTWMSCAVLTLLFFFPGGKRSVAFSWGMAFLVTVLTGKPQVALVALIFMVATRDVQLLWRVVVLTVGSCLVLTPFFGISWPVDYVQLVSSYGTDTASATVARQIGPEVMTNLRGFLYPFDCLSDGQLGRVSWILFGLSSFAVVVAGWSKWLERSSLFAAASLAYLLFCPHLNGYEDLLLVPVLALWLPEIKVGRGETLGLFLVALLILHTGMGLSFVINELQMFNHVFILKLILALWMGFLEVRNHRQASAVKDG